MTLHTVGPEDAAADEQVIGKGYRPTGAVILYFAPFAAAYFLELKWVVAVGFAILISQGNEAGGRLHDLCIRLRRTNVLLREQNEHDR